MSVVVRLEPGVHDLVLELLQEKHVEFLGRLGRIHVFDKEVALLIVNFLLIRDLL